MANFLKDLRRAYPHMAFRKFVEIYEANRESEKLLEILDEAEAEAVKEKKRYELKLKELGELLSASEQHHKLRFVVPADIDLEHAQAILMYGFLMPGSERAFIGGKVIPERNVRENVEHKLGIRFSRTKYDAALAYLKKEGLFHQPTGAGRDEALALKSGAGNGITTHGAQILRVALEFAHQKKRR